MSSVEPSTNQMPFNYDNINPTHSEYSGRKTPIFNGDAANFEWWKDRIYSHITGIDDELWDIVEEGVNFKNLNETGRLSIADKKLLTPTEKKAYIKHHKVKDIIVGAIKHEEYVRIGDKTSAKSIYDSLCSTYDGNEQVQETKASLLIKQYELFTMEKDEDIETMFTRFQTLVAGLKVLKKSYTTYDHVQKILRCLPLVWRPKVTAIEEARDLEMMSLEILISNLRSHEMVLNADSEIKNKSKSVALKSTKTSSKALKANPIEVEEKSSADGQEDEDLALFTKFRQWARSNRKNYRGSASRNSGKKEDQKNCFHCKKPGHFIADCPEMSSKDKSKRNSSKKEYYKNKLKKSLMATFEDLSSESESEEEEANLAFMASADSDIDSDDEPETDSEQKEEVLSKLSRTQLIKALDKTIEKYLNVSDKLETLQSKYDTLSDRESHYQDLYKEALNKITELEKGCPVCYKSNDEHENALQQFVNLNINKSKVASMIYNVCKHDKNGLGYEYGQIYSKPSNAVCITKESPHIYSLFVPESEETKILNASEVENILLKSKAVESEDLRLSNSQKMRSSKLKTIISKGQSSSDIELIEIEDLDYYSESEIYNIENLNTPVLKISESKSLKPS
ncbi:serine/threonine protein kinase SRPK1 [Trifolium pratense]|uniref:Serine/threonine protein kinase SRPK1 n=1 Tax=Trifolium pratense TaxID=57577 RepID=A0A2K3NQD6_TRIPR|nr:serine/threonine protein kinase SRPK1 [Trifolium pratense]